MNKKKLLLYFNYLDKLNLEKSLINLLKNINYKKYDVELFVETNIKINKKIYPKKVYINEYKIYKNKIKIIEQIQNYIYKLKFILKNYHKYDCAILYTPNSLIGNDIVKKASKKTIMYIHTDYTNIYNERQLRKFFTTRNIYDYKNIIFSNNGTRLNFLKYYPSLTKKTHVINSFFDWKELDKKSIDKVKDIKRNNVNLIYVGKLEEEKEKLSIWLKLIKDIKEDIPNIKLYIIGDGIDKYAYESYIDDNHLNNHIFLLGDLENPYPYIKKSNYIIHNNDNYKIINESIMLKTQIISTKKFSDDILELGKDYGFLVSRQCSKMKEEIQNIIKKKEKNNIKIDFETANKEKLDKIEKLINN